MCNARKYILLILLILCANLAYTQETRREISIDFRVNSTYIDPKYSDNAEHLQNIIDLYNFINQDSTINIVEVTFCGAASPEGSYQLNRKLAQGRLSALEKAIRQKIDIPDSIINYNDNYISWDYLKSEIAKSNITHKDKILSIIDEEAKLVNYHYSGQHVDSRIIKLKMLDDGRVWNQLNKLYFKDMRNAYAVFITYKKEIPAQEPEIRVDTVVVTPEPIIEVTPDTAVVVEPIVADVDTWTRKLHLKTNALGLGACLANIAAEIDLARHWSFTLPIYYSALNYFTSSIKFRANGIQPEARYWLSEDNSGIFVGAHFGLVSYNIALNGDYRYQDKDGNTPAIGGGISIGYRKPISADKTWNIEFTLGAGVYNLYYDKFMNTSSTNNGLLIESVKKTYWGLDQLAVTFSYKFDLKKKGGKR